jgi:hypothetical protein
MNIWLSIYLMLGAVSLGVSLAAHGQPKKIQTHNFWSTLSGWLLCVFLR